MIETRWATIDTAREERHTRRQGYIEALKTIDRLEKELDSGTNMNFNEVGEDAPLASAYYNLEYTNNILAQKPISRVLRSKEQIDTSTRIHVGPERNILRKIAQNSSFNSDQSDIYIGENGIYISTGFYGKEEFPISKNDLTAMWFGEYTVRAQATDGFWKPSIKQQRKFVEIMESLTPQKSLDLISRFVAKSARKHNISGF